jgi:hypothetical protein
VKKKEERVEYAAYNLRALGLGCGGGGVTNGMGGKDWEWKLMGCLALIGGASVIAAIACGLVWLVQHVRFV